jgi:hypothetical protein
MISPTRPKQAAYEVDTDGRDVALGVRVVGESKQQARLSNTRVTDEEELEEVVVSAERGQYGSRAGGRLGVSVELRKC